MKAIIGSGIWLVLAGLTWGCSSKDSTNSLNCSVGTEGCPCTNGGACDKGLTCLSKLCVNVAGDSGAISYLPGAGPADGAAVTCKAFPKTVAIAKLSEAFATGAQVQLAVTFYNQGSLRTLAGTSCSPTTSTSNPDPNGCIQASDCGGCVLWVDYVFSVDGVERWSIYGPKLATSTLCESFSGYYEIVDATVAASSSGGSSSAGPCDSCLQTCQGLSSCCTGTGCICQSSCAPTSCLGSLSMCCGPGGSCLCLPNCPY